MIEISLNISKIILEAYLKGKFTFSFIINWFREYLLNVVNTIKKDSVSKAVSTLKEKRETGES